MDKIAKFIVEKRYVFIILILIACIFSIYAMQKVKINYDLTKYLPEKSDTKIALDVMKEEFGLNGVANVVIADVTPEEAIRVRDEITKIDGVLNASFENTSEDYKEGNALIRIILKEGDYASISQNAVKEIENKLSSYTIEMSGSTVHTVSMQDDVKQQMTIILLIAVPIIALILFLNANSYGEILVFGIVIGASVLINKGTNLFLGEISYVTNSITIVLQLALAMDYSIILLHRFEEEKQKYPNEEAIIHALKHSIRSISSSSLTTIVGMIAIMTMQFTIGFDIGIVLAKSIVCSVLSVFLFMPGVLLIFNKLIIKTQHKNFIPKFKFLSKYIIKTRFYMPIVMIIFITLAFIIQLGNTYDYNFDDAKESKYTDVFGKTNTLQIIVPKGNMVKEKNIIDYVNQNPSINSTRGLSTLGIRDELTAEAFAQKTNIDLKTATGLYAYYGQYIGEETEEIKLSYLIEFMSANASTLGLTTEQKAYLEHAKRMLDYDKTLIDFQIFAHALGLSQDEAYLIYAMKEAVEDNLSYEVSSIITYMNDHTDLLGLSDEDKNQFQRIKTLQDSSNQSINYQSLANLLEINENDAYFINVFHEMNLGNENYGISDLMHYMDTHHVELGLTPDQTSLITKAMTIINDKDTLMTSSQFAEYIEIDSLKSALLYIYYNQENNTNLSVIKASTLITFMYHNKESLPLTEEQKNDLDTAYLLVHNMEVNPIEFGSIINIERSNSVGLFTYYASSVNHTPSQYTLYDFIQFMIQNAGLINLNQEQLENIQQIKLLIDNKNSELTAQNMAHLLNIDMSQTYGIYAYYSKSVHAQVSSQNFNSLLQFIKNNAEILNLSEEKQSELNRANHILDNKDQLLNEDEFASIMGMNYNDVRLLYLTYLNNWYTIEELIQYVYKNQASLDLTKEQLQGIGETKSLIDTAVTNYESDAYSRIFFNMNLNIDDKEALDIVSTLRHDLGHYYDEYYVLGDSSNIQDIKESFSHDVFYVNFITILSILIILIITFRSFIIPILLVLVIQGSIWINFAFSTITNTSIMFIGYILVIAIQMGATIDYAIVLTERYREFRKDNSKFDAVKEAIQATIPTLLTSGGILIISGFTVGLVSSIPTISSLGTLIGRGGLISFILVIFLLPQLLLLFDKVVCKNKN